MPRVLAIGIATVDIILQVNEYPAEDSEVRATAQRIARGGNATNTLTVLSQLGHECSWAGMLAEDVHADRIRADLAEYRVDLRHCRRQPQGMNPTSYILVSRANASRTIVHCRDLPEYGYEDFATIDLAGFDWLHFEGRNVAQTRRMLERARQLAPRLQVSVEIEKPRPDIETLLPEADHVLFSRAYARTRGWDDASAFLTAMHLGAPHAELLCSWGERGAWGCDRAGRLHASPAFAPARLVETLGAGDTFNAGYIDACLRGQALPEALTAACRLAGRKCGQQGFAHLAHKAPSHDSIC